MSFYNLQDVSNDNVLKYILKILKRKKDQKEFL